MRVVFLVSLAACGGGGDDPDPIDASLFETHPAWCDGEGSCDPGDCVTVPTGTDTFQGCSFAVPEANGPSSAPASDECLSTPDCQEGGCYPTRNCDGSGSLTYNRCVVDECSMDADCPQEDGEIPQVCLPAGFLNHPVGRCVAARCTQDSDCTARQGGQCLLIVSACDVVARQFVCGYNDDECHSDADCDLGAKESCIYDALEQKLTCES